MRLETESPGTRRRVVVGVIMDVSKISALMVILMLHVQYNHAQGTYVYYSSTSQTTETHYACMNIFIVGLDRLC